MSRLDELIQELCLDGVEYKPLRDVATVSRGGSFQKKDFVKSGFPCIHYGQIYTTYDLFVNDTVSHISPETASKQKLAVTGDVIMAVTSENIEDVCKCVAWLGEGEVAVSGHTAIIHHNQDPKYLVYYLRSSFFYKQKTKLVHGTKVMEVSPNSLLDVVMPFPPLVIQHEIVRILDNLTDLTKGITAELTAELIARNKQYKFFCDKALSGRVSLIPLNEIACKISSGRNKERLDDGDYPVYGSTGIISRTNTPMYDGDRILIARVGANAGFVHLADGKYDVSDNTLIVEVKPEYSLRYIYYQLQNLNLNQYAKGAGQPLITASVLKNLLLYVPNRVIQEKMVSVLDRYNACNNELITMLSKEKDASEKKYNYLCDKLLSLTQRKRLL